MSLYLTADESGKVLAFYDSSVFGQAPAGAVEISQDQYLALRAVKGRRFLNGAVVEPLPPAPIDLIAAVNAERDRRLNLGVMFNGKLFQSDAVSKQRLLGVSLQATWAIVNGAQANDLRWADPNNDFTYISADNTAVVMDAPTTIALGQAVAGHEKAMIYKARALKDRPGGPPDDYADDSHWT